MSVALWITAGLLASVAMAGGISKTFVPKGKLVEVSGGQWTATVSVSFIKTLGVLELLAAVGLILPAALNIAPILVPVTAICWAVLMIGAMITHGRRGELKFMAANLLYFALAVFLASGRFG